MPGNDGARLKNAARVQAEQARDALINRKGIDPVLMDVRGVSGVTDYFVIAAGGSAPHLKALATEVARRWRAAGVARARTTGSVDSGWVVMDGLDVVVHLMTPDLRKRYALEDLWSDAPRIAEGEPAESWGTDASGE